MRRKLILLFSIFTLCLMAFPVNSLAASEGSSKITSITLNFKSEIVVNEEVEEEDIVVTVKGSRYYVDYIEIENDVFRWSLGDTPKLKVYLVAEGDYYFSLPSRNAVTLKGAGATYVSAKKRDSSKTFILTVKLAPLGTEDLQKGSTADELFEVDSQACWTNMGLAGWNEIPEAESYEIRLLRDGKYVGGAREAKEPYFDFSPSMRKAGAYTFKMRALNLGGTGRASRWIDSDSCVVDEQSAMAFGRAMDGEAGWQRNGHGWWYYSQDGSYPTAGWKQIGEKWYFFDEEGYMVKGWIEWEGDWYFCDDSGAMLSNTKTSDGYYLGETGAWIK